MEDLIPLFIKLQQTFDIIRARNCIELPQIISVGAQSAGKSSVIESIVGKDFLPRGNGIVTRCPLVLSLRRIPDGQKEYAEFLHIKNEKITNFDDVRIEIENQTAKIAGKNKGVSN